MSSSCLVNAVIVTLVALAVRVMDAVELFNNISIEIILLMYVFLQQNPYFSDRELELLLSEEPKSLVRNKEKKLRLSEIQE